MSTLYLATDPFVLAEELAAAVEQHIRSGDFFSRIQIIVPNRFLGKWLRLYLARRHGVAINLDITFLEKAMWRMLRGVDPRPFAIEPEMLDGDTYRMLILATLLGEDDAELAPLHHYIGLGNDAGARRSCRRAWDLADRLGGLIRDYEYHRQEKFIQPWIEDLLGKKTRPPADAYERSQRAVFQHIIREPGGKRALFNQARKRHCKTLPQYAMELWDELRRVGAVPLRRRDDCPVAWHLFGITQISALHTHTLRWLGRFFDFRIYHLNPLVGRLGENITPRTLDQALAPCAPGAEGRKIEAGQELLSAWGGAGAEALRLLGDLISTEATAGGHFGPPFEAQILATAKPPRKPGRKKPATVLQRLHQTLLSQPVSPERLPQDQSLQIVGCPGRMREVETVYQSILHNLIQNPQLKQTDIAVLVTDMATYRPFLQAVFNRPRRRLSYNLADYSAAGLSAYGQAFLGMLDLALESFTRSRVFDVLLNPCYLARLGATRDQATVWLDWAENLGIYRGWDAAEKQERGQAASPLFSWRLGLQRLRLGRYMDAQPVDSQHEARRFGSVIPYADMASGDREQLDAFSRAVEDLLPQLWRLRRHHGNGASWAEILRYLGQRFLEVPSDRPEEAQVRDRLFDSLEHLGAWDQLFGDSNSSEMHHLPLALVREMVRSCLETIEGSHGEYLTGGVTISALQPMRPVPFSIVYILGLGEDLFPGNNRLPQIDLRNRDRLPGDIRPAENARFLFLESILSARQKCYLLYNCRDLQKDRDLLPAVPVLQLKRFLSAYIIDGEFAIAKAPLHGHDPNRLEAPPASCDALVDYDENERLLALALANDENRLRPDLLVLATLEDKLRERVPDFSLPADKAARSAIPSISIRELKRFLENPARAGLKRHLHLEDDEDVPQEDDEPFVTPGRTANQLMRQVLEGFVHQAVQHSVDSALADWPRVFVRLYDDWRLRCRVPDGAFGEVDRATLHDELKGRLETSVADFLRARADQTFCGPLLLGQYITPLAPRRRFPALELELPRSVLGLAGRRVKLHGYTPLAWSDGKDLDILVLTQVKEVKEDELSEYLFEPVLLFLALRAQARSGIQDAWPEDGNLNVHICHRGGMASFLYSARDLPAAEARAYLSELAADFLDPTAFDLLTFDVIRKDKDLKQAYTASEELAWLRENYVDRLEEAIEEADERSFGRYSYSEVVELSGATVPADAYVKVRRRFRIMDMGPARARQAEEE